MLLMTLGVVALSALYYFVGTRFGRSTLRYSEYLAFTTVLAFVIVGGYQIFFWVQRNNYFFRTRCLKCRIDDLFPFWPVWVWPYSVLYSIMIGMVVIQIRSITEGVYLVFGGIVLLAAQSICFMIFPCTVPSSYRAYPITGVSTRYLRFIQGIDNGRNCFPSMHCSVAMFVGLSLLPSLSYFGFIFVVIIALSCLFVKQHQIADIPAGIALGWAVFVLVSRL